MQINLHPAGYLTTVTKYKNVECVVHVTGHSAILFYILKSMYFKWASITLRWCYYNRLWECDHFIIQ